MLTPRASSWETNPRDALPLDLGLPSFGRISSFLFPVMIDSSVTLSAEERSGAARMLNVSSPYQIAFGAEIGAVLQKTMCRQ
jgi:hypothetical protein